MLSIFRMHQKVNYVGSKQTILSHCLRAGYRHSVKASHLKTKKTLKTRSLTHFRLQNQFILEEANRNLLKPLETILYQKGPNRRIKMWLNANLQKSVAIMSSKAAIQTLIFTRLPLKIASLRSRPIISFRLKTPILSFASRKRLTALSSVKKLAQSKSKASAKLELISTSFKSESPH